MSCFSGDKLACGSHRGILAIFSALGEEKLQVCYDSAPITDLLYVSEVLLLSAKSDGKIQIWNDGEYKT